MATKTQEQIMANWGASDQPLVSVCCTAFNHEHYITEALDGFLMQTTDFPFEIIVRDDCSTDRTAEIIRRYEQQYPLIIKPIYEIENQYSQGVAPMSPVFEQSKGEYLALCEGDDYWTDEHKLQYQMDFLSANLDYSVCYTAATVIDDEGQVIEYNKNLGDSDKNMLISGRGSAITGSIFFRRFDWSEWAEGRVLNGDVLLWHFLGFIGACKCLDSIGNSVYRIHPGGIWSGRSNRDKLLGSLNTFSVLRKSIEKKLPNDREVMKLHQTVYKFVFEKYFFTSIKSINLGDYYFGVKKLYSLKHVNRFSIYFYHLFKLAIRLYRKILKQFA